jgi:hypothetical protein
MVVAKRSLHAAMPGQRHRLGQRYILSARLSHKARAQRMRGKISRQSRQRHPSLDDGANRLRLEKGFPPERTPSRKNYRANVIFPAPGLPSIKCSRAGLRTGSHQVRLLLF